MNELPRGHRLKHYRVIAPIGRGGMGVVYRAHDDRLDREVAVKMIAGLVTHDAIARFWREARAAASVSHPNVCQIFEVDECDSGIFLAMELLEGEPLDARLARGPVAVHDAVPIASGLLNALAALHGRGLVHRDIKPSNIFLTPHGAKLLDFGLARAVEAETVRLHEGGGALTEAGMLIGTPLYMSPEQARGTPLDARTDVYSAGAVLFHMLAGRPPFAGTSVDLLHAALHSHPPALEGPPAVIAIDRVIRRAMLKDPDARFASADDMAAAVSQVSLAPGAAGPAAVSAMTRIVVPPIRLARPDDEAAFLSFALAEAVSGSLASVNHVVVRSPSIAARWDDTTHPRTMAADADVDLIIAGRLLRSGSQLRISAQLIDAMGTVLGSTTVDGSMNDIFALEDAFSTAAVSLIQRHAGDDGGTFTMTVRRDVPASPRAFELFLRGSEEARRLDRMKEARDLLLEAVEDDPSFAPAWAALGRAHRVYGKFYGQRQLNVARAEDAFHHALELSPDLPAAHSYLTHLEAEMGRADQAIARLLRHAASHRRDAGWFVGLVHALRYCGVIDASIAAHEEARRLDPNVPTGVEYARIHEIVTPDAAIRQAEAWRPGDEIGGLWPLIAFGVRTERAVASIAAFDRSKLPPVYRTGFDAIVASACEPTAIALEQLETAVTVHDDPEGLFFYGTAMISVGATERGLDVIEQNVLGGYAAVNLLEHCFAFDAVRGTPRFARILTGARRRNDRARSIFKQGGGATLLGMH